MNKRNIKFYIIPGDSTYNRGDRINLMSQQELLVKHFPGCEIVFESSRPVVDDQWYPGKAIQRRFIPTLEQIQLMKQADVIIWGGGALLSDNASRTKIPYHALLITFIKLVLRKPVMAWAHGIVITTNFGKWWAKIPLGLVDRISVRDQNSFKKVQEVNPHLEARVTADPAVLAKPGSESAGRNLLSKEGVPNDGRPLVMMANTFCTLRFNPQVWIPWVLAHRLGMKREYDQVRLERMINSMARTINLINKKMKARVLLVPTYPAPWEINTDLQMFEQVKSKVDNSDDVFILRRDSYPTKDYLAMWHHFVGAISIPMHHCIASTLMNVPCVNLYYEPKGKDFFERLGATERLMKVQDFESDGGPDKAVKMLMTAIKNWETVGKKTRSQLQVIQEDGRQNVAILKRLVAELQH